MPRTAARSKVTVGSSPTSAGFPDAFWLAQQANNVRPKVREVGNVYCKTNRLLYASATSPSAATLAVAGRGALSGGRSNLKPGGLKCRGIKCSPGI